MVAAVIDAAIGVSFVVEVCPECGLLHIGPVVPWHTMDCSEPDLVQMVAQIQGPYTAEDAA